MEIGERVRVRAYGGRVLERVVVEVRDDAILVCTPEEIDAATKRGRRPVCVGFPLSELVQEPSGA